MGVIHGGVGDLNWYRKAAPKSETAADRYKSNKQEEVMPTAATETRPKEKMKWQEAEGAFISLMKLGGVKDFDSRGELHEQIAELIDCPEPAMVGMYLSQARVKSKDPRFLQLSRDFEAHLEARDKKVPAKAKEKKPEPAVDHIADTSKMVEESPQAAPALPKMRSKPPKAPKSSAKPESDRNGQAVRMFREEVKNGHTSKKDLCAAIAKRMGLKSGAVAATYLSKARLRDAEFLGEWQAFEASLPDGGKGGRVVAGEPKSAPRRKKPEIATDSHEKPAPPLIPESEGAAPFTADQAEIVETGPKEPMTEHISAMTEVDREVATLKAELVGLLGEMPLPVLSTLLQESRENFGRELNRRLTIASAQIALGQTTALTCQKMLKELRPRKSWWKRIFSRETQAIG